MDSKQIAKNIELFLSPDNQKQVVTTIVDYCVFLYFNGVSKTTLGAGIQTLLDVYPEYETELEDSLDWVLGNGSAWFKFPFTCKSTGFNLETMRLL